MNNKNNTGLIILVIILVIGGLCIFILYDKVLPDNNNDLNQKQIDEIGNRINNQISQNANDYISLEATTVGTNNSQVDKVTFKNVDSNLTYKFLKEQEELFNKIEQSTKAKSNVSYEINNYILTIHYEMTFDLAISDDCKEIITTNIDVKNNKQLTNEEVLQLANLTFKNIAEKEYNRRIENKKDSDFVIMAKDNTKALTKKEFIEKKNEITSNIVNGLEDVIHAYIQNNTVKYDYTMLDIETLYSNPGKGGCFSIKTETVGNINK